MTAQLATALKRSVGTVAPVVILLGSAFALQLLFPASGETKTILQAALMSFAALMPILTRGLVEGLSDGQRNAAGVVLASDVTPAVVSGVESVADPVVEKALSNVGVDVSDAQIKQTVQAVETAVEADLKATAPEATETPVQVAKAAIAPSAPVAPGPKVDFAAAFSAASAPKKA